MFELSYSIDYRNMPKSGLIEKNPKVNEVQETIPMKRFGTMAEFAAAAAFLVSERASYITGQSLAVDGGWIKGH